jgi:hypothetical protein
MAMNLAAPTAPSRSVPLVERILLAVLYITVLLSCIAFIEPSPHDGLMGLLALTCVVAGVRIERKITMLILLLMAWNVSGLVSLLNVAGENKAVQYTATSFYLALAAILFACLFAEKTMPRLASMRTAYIASATITALAGIAGYFHLFPGSDLFVINDRAQGTFKDPNVFGPFLIWPTVFMITRMLSREISLRALIVLGILLLGILLSFSRGAWINFGTASAVTLFLMLITAPTPQVRLRLVSVSVVGLCVLAGCFVVLLSLDSVRDMFAVRAQAVQYYDVGEGGRFKLQELALAALFDYPFGMGPFEFVRLYGLQQHNVYLQAFMVYGWVGGVVYLLMLAITLMVGFRNAMVRTPWQPYLITAIAAFTGDVVEGAVIDTDHWRHYFLLLGMIWGLSAATMNQMKLSRPMQAV